MSVSVLLALLIFTPNLDSTERENPSRTSALRVQLIIQEAIYSGVSGIARHQEPVTVGLPLADSAGVRSISQLGLSGAEAGQFRVLGHWPSGNIQWVLVDTLADVAAGRTNNSIYLTSGNGNFGGPDLATENATSISISTGAASFVVRKRKFNLIDQDVFNNRSLIKEGASSGLVIMGPIPGNTTCPCSTVYSSSNDDSSDSVIEENGPVRAVIRSTGQLKDQNGHAYMRYTVRMHFFRGKARVKAVVTLQNADYGPSNSFASAYKGFRSFEARLAPELDGKRRFRFGQAKAVKEGSINDGENADLYQAYSDKMEHFQWSSPERRKNFPPRSYIKRSLASATASRQAWTYTQEGCLIARGSETLARTGRSEYCAGWADLSDSSGAGIEVGTHEMAAYWPKSLEFTHGGNEIRIGLWPDQSLFGSGGQDYFQAWPQYSIQTIYLSFHSDALTGTAEEFDKLDHPLLARASVSYYDATHAFLYPMLDPERIDKYIQSLGVECCIHDPPSPHVYRTYNWSAAGGGNQAEMRWSNLLLWLQRGHVARYLDASNFYLFQSEQVFPRSDYNGDKPFHWRDRPDSELDAFGRPDRITSLNDNIGCDPQVKSCGRNWIDSAHAHWYGMMDFYFLTGDETIKDAILDGASDIYGNPNISAVKNGSYYNSRNVGEALMSDARLAMFYRSLGSPKNATDALEAGTQVMRKQVWPDLQVSGFGTAEQGVSRTRGFHFGCCPRVNRFATPFQQGILSEGLWEFMQAEGPDWPERQLTFDLAYGIANWTLTEAWRSNGNATSCTSGTGPTYTIFIDRPNPALTPACSQTVWFTFYNLAKYTGAHELWADKFVQYMKHLNGGGDAYAEYGSIFQGAVIGEVINPEPTQLTDVSVKIQQSAPGSYHLSWTVPAGAQGYRLKYSDRIIVEWLDFDPGTGNFGKDPKIYIPWFAAEEAKDIPAVGAPKSIQTFDITGLETRRDWHFALKALVKVDDHQQ